MKLNIAIEVADPRDHRHLLTTLRHAASLVGDLALVESALADADVVILRRDEAHSGELLRACNSSGRPIPVIYSVSEARDQRWTLRWPARTADVVSLAGALADAVVGNRGTPSPNPR